MSWYRLEACSCCGIVRLAMTSALTRQRERDKRDIPEYLGEVVVWRVDCCEPCRKVYEAIDTGETP